MVRFFLAAHLQGDSTAASHLARLAPPPTVGADFFTLRRLPALPPAPTEEELFREMIAEAYPVSVEARLALGEAYLAADRRPDARRTLTAALGLVKTHAALGAEQQTDLRQRIEERLREAGG